MIDLFCVFCLFFKLKIFKCEPFDSTGIKLEYAKNQYQTISMTVDT